jgi:integrase/recombinase XerD
VRIGEALGLRHEDLEIAGRTVTVTPRPNANRARAKSGISRTVPASAELMRLYAGYLNREYRALDSDYVFVNLFSEPHGRPWTYAAVYDLVLRLRRRTGIDFGPHQYRHTYATWLRGFVKLIWPHRVLLIWPHLRLAEMGGFSFDLAPLGLW